MQISLGIKMWPSMFYFLKRKVGIGSLGLGLGWKGGGLVFETLQHVKY